MRTLSDDDQFQAAAMSLHFHSTGNNTCSVSPPDLPESEVASYVSKSSTEGRGVEDFERAMIERVRQDCRR